jgi:uncharacterized repeat protein (TIGR03833 family)
MNHTSKRIKKTSFKENNPIKFERCGAVHLLLGPKPVQPTVIHPKQGLYLTMRNLYHMDLPKRTDISPGMLVRIIEKHNQRSGEETSGIVRRILTKSPTHPHGIKVQLTDGRVGRVQKIPKQTGEEG